MIQEEYIINQIEKRVRFSAPEINIPNTSGDHLGGIKRNTPTASTDLVNKEYADAILTTSPIRIGSALTYIEVDTSAHKIVMYINGTQVGEWS